MKLSFRSSTPEKSSTPSVFGLPGHVFFCRRLDLPAGMEASEVAGFVELQLEELSPFPLDQLYHGHVVSGDRAAVFVYAAYKRRFSPEEAGAWKNVALVIPDFAPAAKLTFERDATVYLRSALSMSALFFEANRELPARVVSLPLSVDASSQEIDSIRRELAQRIGTASTEEDSRRIAGNPEERTKGRLFVIESESDGAPWEVMVTSGERWTMDVRDASYLAEKRRQLGFDVILWRVVLGVAALMGLLVVGEAVLLGTWAYGAWLNSRIESQTARAESLADFDAVARRVQDFEEGDLRPFEMLNILLASMPDNLAFSSATATGRNTLEVHGTAGSVAEINTYRSRLANVPEVERVEIADERTRADGTTFTAIISFRAGVFGTIAAQGES